MFEIIHTFVQKMTKRFKLGLENYYDMQFMYEPVINSGSGTTSISEAVYIQIRDRLNSASNQLKIQNEKHAFLKKKTALMNDPNMKGKYVAVHDGEVIDSDVDEIVLMQRVYKNYGYVPILIERVVEETKVIFHSPRTNVY